VDCGQVKHPDLGSMSYVEVGQEEVGQEQVSEVRSILYKWVSPDVLFHN
jgi:hypothetical protein